MDEGKIYIDRDEYEEQDGGLAKIACTRLYRVNDWRLSGKSWISAYFAGELRPNDIKLFTALAGFTVLILLSMLILPFMPGALKGGAGLIASFPIVYLATCFWIGSSVIY